MIDVSYPGTAGRADTRGWGPGWPTDRSGAMVPLVVRGVDFGPGVQASVRDLITILVEESLERGYLTRLINTSCFSYANRAIKSSDGSATDVPSNHSWGLAVDINAVENVYGSSQHAIPLAMGALWNAYGFRWGGDYPNTKDWMHFEFMGTPADAAALLAKAQEELTDMAFNDYVEGVKAFRARSTRGDPGPPPNGSSPHFVVGWSMEREIYQATNASGPAPGPGGPFAPRKHSHGPDETPHTHLSGKAR